MADQIKWLRLYAETIDDEKLRLLAEGHTQKAVAERYGVHSSAVSKAIQSWERATGSAVEWGDAA